MAENYKRINLKRKVFSRGKKQNFKRFKKTPKYVKDNPENQVAKEVERDAYHFTDSEEDDGNDLGMGLEISDLPGLDADLGASQKDLIALTQDSVGPLFSDAFPYDDSKLEDGLAELRYSSFRPNQKEAVKRILHARSTLFISPTGSGKSLCYQLAALLYWRYRKYITIVVSPLISLMEDQMTNFPASLKAVSLHSGHNIMQRRRSIEQLVVGDAQVAFISPEAIVSGLLNLDDLKNLPPVGFVCIDEAHCLSEWSHNFRPAYMQFFKILNQEMRIKTFLGLTATATRATSVAISKSLNIDPQTDIIGSTTVPDNLMLSVSYERNKEKALIELLKSPTFRILDSIIVYCNRREETENVASRIRTAMQNYSTIIEAPVRVKRSSKDDSMQSVNNSDSSTSEKPVLKLSWRAEAYHAGMSTESRKRIQRQFIKGELRVVVATIAFGMGINKANVRAIIHYDMPSSFESYVQEIGRAGRDGKPAQCHMFLKSDKTDLFYQQRNIYSSIAERKNLKKLIEYLFKPCRCICCPKKQYLEELDKSNQSDPHEVCNSFTDTHFNSVANQRSGDTSDSACNDENQHVEKENCPVKRKSVVRKHRLCKEGHEVAFGVEEATNDINLKPESIITLICQIQQAYPQLQIRQYTPTKSTCNLLCYNGSAQMEALAARSPPIKIALMAHKHKQIKAYGTAGEIPNRLSFDVIEIASKMGKSYAEVVRMLKKTEWELVEKTGRFRRSQVRVNFDGNSFHVNAVGDINEKEAEELNNFLLEFTRSYENIEREKIARVYATLKRYCIGVDKMKDKAIRLEASSRLKAALNAYFNSSPDQQQQLLMTADEIQIHLSEVNTDNQDAEEAEKFSRLREESVRKNARAFISAHGKDYTAHAIARIFQGISTPNYPAEIWGLNRKWWRIHLDVDFLHLLSIIREELAAVRLMGAPIDTGATSKL